MLVEVKVPVFSESVTEGTLLGWQKKVGEKVERDEVLIEVETDKVVLEVTAPQAGVLTAVHKNAGDVVESQELLATIDTEAAAAAPAAAAPAAAQPAAAPLRVSGHGCSLAGRGQPGPTVQRRGRRQPRAVPARRQLDAPGASVRPRSSGSAMKR